MEDVLELEVFLPSRGRRRWPDALKAQIVSESLEPGIKVQDVARKYELRPHRVSEWRRLARDGKLVLPALESDGDVDFAPVEITPISPEAQTSSGFVDIIKGEVTVRLSDATPASRIGEIVSAL